MKKWCFRSALTLLVVLVVAGLSYHLVLRPWCLTWGATDDELRAALPGDNLFPGDSADATHAITIHATPQQIWPWLMQIGQDRSGFYSYTFLENLFGADMPKVERIVPDWKPRVLGESVWMATPRRFGGRGRMITTVVEPDRAFAMVAVEDWQALCSGGVVQHGMWTFALEPQRDGQTRLIARLRGGTPPTLMGRLVGRLFWEPAHFVMEQKMLRRIRDLSERG